MTPVRKPIRRLVIVGTSLLALILLTGFLEITKSWATNPADQVSHHSTANDEPTTQTTAEKSWVIRAYYSDPEMVVNLAGRIEPWEINQELGYAVLEADLAEIQWLEVSGFQVVIDDQLTLLSSRDFSKLPGQSSGIPGYPCYRTLTETFETANNLADEYPELVSLIDIGDSWEKTDSALQAGHDLLVVKLTNAQRNQTKPKLFIMASMHPRELAPAELSTRFAEYLLVNYNKNADITWLLDYNEIHLLQQANPDGRLHAETGQFWRKNTNNDYCTDTNNRGADLNRNFSFQWGCCGGSSSNVCDELYRGPNPSSEPETLAIQTYFRSQYPDLRQEPLNAAAPITTTGVFIDLHSYSGLILWPWGFTTTLTSNSTALETLGRKLAFFNDYTPQQAMKLYPTDGSTIDFAYGELGVPAYTFEIGTSFFQDCSTFESAIVPDNIPALIYAAKTIPAPYMLPYGPDVITITLSQTTTIQGGRIQIRATLDDTRFMPENGTLPGESINRAELYLDNPPDSTQASPIPVPLLPADGEFDSAIESALGEIDTQGLSAGRHSLFLRGQDSNGNWGPFTAEFFYIEPITLGSEGVFFPLLFSNHSS